MTKLTHIPDEMQKAIEAFKENTDKIISSFHRRIEATPIPKLIFHYTDDAGLRGILQTGTLWMTDIFYLNDPSELRHGCKPAVELITASGNDEQAALAEFAVNLTAKLQGDLTQNAEIFALSFSKDGNDLSQWRAYADNGHGYALGFDAQMLEEAFVKSRPGYMTFPVCYSDSDLYQMQKNIIDEARPLITMRRGDGLSSEAITDYLSTLLVIVAWQVLRVAVFFKHWAYQNEQEYRFLELFMTNAVPNVKYRTRPYTLIRYTEFDWRNLVPSALKEIIVGPASAHSDKARRFANDCLRRYHTGSVEVWDSGIPYQPA
jgi:Protein of unknown function (DUF2971)